MRKPGFMVVVAAILCFAGAAFAADQSALMAKSDEAWKNRNDMAAFKAVIPDLEAAFKADDKNFELAWRLARAYFWVADQGDNKVKADAGEKGTVYGELAATLDPKRVEGWYYTSTACGMYSEGIGRWEALKKGLKNKIKDNFEKAILIDKNYEGAAPLRTKGRFYARLPGIAGGSNKKALEFLGESLKIAPDRLRTKYYIAEVLDDDGKKDEAKKMFEEVMAADPKAGDYADNLVAQKWAKAFMKKYEKK